MQVNPAEVLLKRKCLALAIAITASLSPQMVQAAGSEAKSIVETVPAVQPMPAAQLIPAPVIHVSNFERVSPTLMRGGAPSSEALQELKAAGVKTIVNLRGEGAASQKEARQAREIGLEYYNVPMGFSEPNLAKVSSVLDIIRDQSKQPVYIHCLQGADRTGMIVGINRVLQDGWKFDRAYSEMRGHHFKPFLIPMRKTVQAFASGKYTYVERQGITIAGVSSKPSGTRLATEKSL